MLPDVDVVVLEASDVLDEDDAATDPPVDVCSTTPGSTTLPQASSRHTALTKPKDFTRTSVYRLFGIIAVQPQAVATSTPTKPPTSPVLSAPPSAISS